MTDDIVTRLRETFDKKLGDFRDLLVAADEIEHLRAVIFNIQKVAHEWLPNGTPVWGAINQASDVASNHFQQCECGERYD